jgi:M6 family metalloprotease-like protein
MSHRRSGTAFTPRIGFRPTFVLCALAALVLLVGGARGAAAQPAPPHPGVPLPPGYYDRLATDRDAFHFKHAWIAQTKRIRQNRRLLEMGAISGVTAEAAGGFRVEGTRRVPVLAGKFSNTGADPYSPAQLQQQLFDGPNPTGTITQYYADISRGYLTLTGTVYGAQGDSLFQVSQPDTYYEGPAGCNGLCGSAHTGEYLKELLDGADPWVDFAQFDNDGPDGVPNSGDDDGYVDFVAFVQPERGGECGTNNIWSHRWVYEGWWGAPYTTNDPAANGGYIKVSDYTIQPLVSCNGSSLIEIGVYTHEFGHAFGLPDLYDTDGSSEGIGNWGLMAAGSYGGDGVHPATPSHMCAWSKEQLGWVDPVVLCDDQTGVSLSAVETGGDVLKIYPHGHLSDEYFLVENRVRTGYDTYLPVSGIAVWHIDNSISDNTNEAHKLVDLEEADGLNQLDLNANRGDAGDLFPGSSNNQLFSDATNPNAKDYAGANTGFSAGNFGGTADPRTLDVTVTHCQLAVGDARVDDSPMGNNNRTLDGNERANLHLALRNDFAGDETGVSGTLSSLTPGVVVLQDSVYFGTVANGALNYGSGDFGIEATGPLADGAEVSFQLDLTGDGGYASTASVVLHAGNYVLLVEDDAAAGNDTLFEAAITGAGRAYVLHDASAEGVPALGAMQAARAVVWYTGIEWDNTFTPDEQAVVEAYLDAGGSLFVTGQDIGYDLVDQGSAADQTFYTDYLHADFISDSSSDNTLTGATGDPIGDGISLNLAGGDGADNSTYPSVITPAAGASTVFSYSAAKRGAIRYGTGQKLVYFAFNFEAINAAATRTLTMQRVLDWIYPADLTPPAAAVLAPNGGEVLESCGTSPITWTASDANGIAGVDLFWTDDSTLTLWQTIASDLPNTGTYDWVRNGLAADSVWVKVVARDPSDLQGVDVSDAAFTVAPTTPPSAAVLSPNGGESYGYAAPVTVTWSMADTCVGVDSTRVFFSPDGGGSWAHLATVSAPDTTYGWTTPSAATDSGLVRVEVVNGAGIAGSDTSDAFFSIVDSAPPSVTLLSPNGGETFGTGNPVTVTWQGSDDVGIDHYALFFSPDAGGWWSVIDTLLTDTTTVWTAPDIPSALYLIRVVAFDAQANSAADTSDSAFTVADDDPPAVAVSAPNGGELVNAGDVVNIQASVGDNVGVDSVCVSYTLDDGGSWTPIACGTVSFPYPWSTPSTASDSCRVRVEAWDAAGNPASDVSDSTFSLVSSTAVPSLFAGMTHAVLLQSRPNPMGAAGATFAFYLPAESPVTLRIYDLSGRLVRTVASGDLSGGYHEIRWNGTADTGVAVSHGIYFYVLQTPERREVRKLVKLE